VVAVRDESEPFAIAVGRAVRPDLIGAEVQSVDFSREGELAVTFRNGERLLVGPVPDVEAWQITGPGGLLVVCMPGGGEPAIWDENSLSFPLA
jgi:hypothetical protein